MQINEYLNYYTFCFIYIHLYKLYNYITYLPKYKKIKYIYYYRNTLLFVNLNEPYFDIDWFFTLNLNLIIFEKKTFIYIP